MIGFIGLPPTGLFVGKFYVFSALYERGWIWLMVIGAVFTAVSIYYYLGVVRSMYMRARASRPSPAGGSPPRDLALDAAIVISLIVAVGSFFAVDQLIELVRDATTSCPTRSEAALRWKREVAASSCSGGGSTGEAFAAALRRLDADVPITLVERELVGGECSLLRLHAVEGAAAARRRRSAAAQRVPGAAEAVTGGLDADRVFWHRDQVTGGWDDSGQETFLADARRRARSRRRAGRRPGLVEVGDREHPVREARDRDRAQSPSIPPVPGLADVRVLDEPRGDLDARGPREHHRPRRRARSAASSRSSSRGMGSRVTLVDIAERLLPASDPEAGALLARSARSRGHRRCRPRRKASSRVEPGIRVHLSRTAASSRRERLLVATGRRANVEGFGFEQLGADDHATAGSRSTTACAPRESVWAIGDVNGIAMFTHVGKYQARVAAADVAGPSRARPTTAPCPPSRSPIRRSPRSAGPPAKAS